VWGEKHSYTMSTQCTLILSREQASSNDTTVPIFVSKYSLKTGSSKMASAKQKKLFVLKCSQLYIHEK
jgi:hypothetical protein